MLAARRAALDELKLQYPGVEDGVLLSRMVAYCSKLVCSTINAVLVQREASMFASMQKGQICNRTTIPGNNIYQPR